MRAGLRSVSLLALAIAVSAAALAPPAQASAQSAKDAQLRSLSVRRDLWAEAVDAHEPGVADDAVRTILAMGERTIDVGLGHALVGFERLSRALVLHTDAAMIDPAGDAVAGRPPSRQLEDGRQVGVVPRSRHWRFATQIAIGLARAVEGPRAEQARVAAAHRLSALWFRTIAVLSLQRGELGLADATLGWGLRLFPDDPDLRLITGTLHQAYADPRVQRFAGRDRMPPKGLIIEPRTRSDAPPPVLGPQSESSELSLAEANLRRALTLQPALWEARVRLAHVLTDRGGNAEAASLAAAALEGGLPPFYESYALLILGRSSARLGRLDDARTAFTRAATLAPTAQAPRVGLAQVALAEGKATAALAQLTSLSEPDHAPPSADEEWLVYFRVHDPGAETLLAELREAVR